MIFSFYDNYLLFYFYFLIYKIKIILVLKTYKIFKEGLLNKLTGPTAEESWEYIKNKFLDGVSYIRLYNSLVDFTESSYLPDTFKDFIKEYYESFIFIFKHSFRKKRIRLFNELLRVGYDLIIFDKDIINFLMIPNDDNLLKCDLLDIIFKYDRVHNKLLNGVKNNKEYIDLLFKSYLDYKRIEIIRYMLEFGLRPSKGILDDIIKYSLQTQNNEFSVNYNNREYYIYKLIKKRII